MIDELLPGFDVESRHETLVDAPARIVYEHARRLDMSRSRAIRILMRLRGMPASALTVEGLDAIRFKIIRERPGEHFVLGVMGKFWTLRGGLDDFDPKRFAQTFPPGCAKAVWSFSVKTVSENSSLLSTATRVWCPDRISRIKFRIYWTVVGPFSGLIRVLLLRSVKRSAESMFADVRRAS